jgi:hypothetical protein
MTTGRSCHKTSQINCLALDRETVLTPSIVSLHVSLAFQFSKRTASFPTCQGRQTLKEMQSPLEVQRSVEVRTNRSDWVMLMSLPPNLLWTLPVPLFLRTCVRWVSHFPTSAKWDPSTRYFESQHEPHLLWAISRSCQCVLPVHPVRAPYKTTD